MRILSNVWGEWNRSVRVSPKTFDSNVFVNENNHFDPTKCVEHYRIHLSSTLFSVQTATGSILRCTVNRKKMMCHWYLFCDTVGGGITYDAVYSTAPGLERTILGGENSDIISLNACHCVILIFALLQGLNAAMRCKTHLRHIESCKNIQKQSSEEQIDYFFSFHLDNGKVGF